MYNVYNTYNYICDLIIELGIPDGNRKDRLNILLL